MLLCACFSLNIILFQALKRHFSIYVYNLYQFDKFFIYFFFFQDLSSIRSLPPGAQLVIIPDEALSPSRPLMSSLDVRYGRDVRDGREPREGREAGRETGREGRDPRENLDESSLSEAIEEFIIR